MLHKASASEHFIASCYAMVCYKKVQCDESRADSQVELCEVNCIGKELCGSLCLCCPPNGTKYFGRWLLFGGLFLYKLASWESGIWPLLTGWPLFGGDS